MTKVSVGVSGSKDGIEWRTNVKGKKSYRGLVRVKGHLQRGPWGAHAEARAWRAKALGEIAAGTGRPRTTMTLADAASEFVAGIESGSISNRSGQLYKPTTIRGYKHDIIKVLDELGPHKLSDVRRADVQAMVDRWAAGGWKPSSIRNALDPLRVIYRRSMTRDLLSINPVTGVEVPASREEPMQIVSPDDAARLIAALPHAEAAIWACAFYAGLRRGELQGLRWSDVDLR